MKCIYYPGPSVISHPLNDREAGMQEGEQLFLIFQAADLLQERET